MKRLGERLRRMPAVGLCACLALGVSMTRWHRRRWIQRYLWRQAGRPDVLGSRAPATTGAALVAAVLALNLLLAAPALGTTLFADDFESAAWSTTGVGGAKWQPGYSSPNAGWYIDATRASGAHSAHAQTIPVNDTYGSAAAVLGPFSFFGTAGSFLEFDVWYDTEPVGHRLMLAISQSSDALEGTEIVGDYTGSSSGWRHVRLDLTRLRIYPSVYNRDYIRTVNLADGGTQYFQFWYETPADPPSGEGIWLDNVRVGYSDPAAAGTPTGAPKASLGTPVAPKTLKRSKSYTVYGSLKPKHTAGSKPVRIYKYKKIGKKWVKKGYVKAKAYNYKGYTRYKVKMKLTSKGRWRLRACAPADSGHATTWSSKYDYVKVR